MPGRAAKITITERQRDVLEGIVAAPTTANRLSQRAEIILAGFARELNEDIAERVDLERHQVGVWRLRWAAAFERLVVIECLETAAALRRAIEDVLNDAPRPGAPGKFTAEQWTLILALACEPPAQSGRPISHWTARELADEAAQRGIVTSISPSQIQRFLKEAELQPHRSRYWLNSKAKNTPEFNAQVRQVCDTYENAPRLYQLMGMRTICTDERTGMQALERIFPTQGMTIGHAAHMEFEYKRHGTQCLIANRCVVTGKIIAATVQQTRTEADFVAHMEQTVAVDPQAFWTVVLDNLNIHCSESLVRWVAEKCGVKDDLGVKGKQGILKSTASRRTFLKDLKHRIRFVFTPKHTSWLNQIEIWFGILSRKFLKRGSFTSVADLKQRVLSFIDYFNRTMAKPFQWTFTGKVLKV